MLQPPILEGEVYRAVLLLVPVAIWITLLLSRQFSAKENTGALLAFIWHFQAALIITLWFSSKQIAELHYDVLLGQAALIGAVNFLALGKKGFAMMAFACLPALVFYVPEWQTAPMFFVLIVLLAAFPALVLAICTARSSHIYVRSVLQALMWACLLLWLFPSMVFVQTHHSWQVLLSRPLWQQGVIAVPLIIPAFFILSALYHFAVEGNGTGFPYDPPVKLVTKGAYAYISNPMQLGICLMMLWWGVMLGSAWISLSAFGSVFLFVVFKDICNGSCAIGETDKNWARYQSEVPRWIPRLRPWKLETRDHE
jgi:protein-S-isoprenylcysteine O-methyltransferase Ste14